MDAARLTGPDPGPVKACPLAPSSVTAVRQSASLPDTYARVEAERVLESLQVVNPAPPPQETRSSIRVGGRPPLEQFWRWLRPPEGSQDEPYDWVVEERDLLRQDNRRLRHALDRAQKREEAALGAHAQLAHEVDIAIEELRAPSPVRRHAAKAREAVLSASVHESARVKPAPVSEMLDLPP